MRILQVLVIVLGLVLTGCVTTNKNDYAIRDKTPQCAAITADFYQEVASARIDFFPPASTEEFGIVHGASFRPGMVTLLCLVPPIFDHTRMGCLKIGDIRDTCLIGDIPWAYGKVTGPVCGQAGPDSSRFMDSGE